MPWGYDRRGPAPARCQAKKKKKGSEARHILINRHCSYADVARMGRKEGANSAPEFYGVFAM